MKVKLYNWTVKCTTCSMGMEVLGKESLKEFLSTHTAHCFDYDINILDENRIVIINHRYILSGKYFSTMHAWEMSEWVEKIVLGYIMDQKFSSENSKGVGELVPSCAYLVEIVAVVIERIDSEVALKYTSISPLNIRYAFDLDGLSKKILDHLLERQKTRESISVVDA